MHPIHWSILAAIALYCLTACAGKRIPPNTAKVRAAGEVAKSRVKTATTKVQKLKEEVPAELKPDVQSVEDDLAEALVQLEVQSLAVDRLDRDIAVMAANLEKEAIWRRRWRRIAIWLGVALVVAGLYIFRKPLRALL